MDMEKLSKSQIILLTLLVSFVTSIATGIVTVSLMEQAPPAVAQTVNRIIERTVEKVVPAGQAAASVVTQEKTIIVNESQLISKAVARAEASIVRLYSNNAEDPTFLGIGVVVDSSGTIVGDAVAFGEAVNAVVELVDQTHVRAVVSSTNATSGLMFFSTATTTTDGKPVTWTPINVDGGHPMLGETVVMIAGKTIARIAIGIITTLASSDSAPRIIETDIAPDSILYGSPLIDTDGSLLGISTGVSRVTFDSSFISASTREAGENKAE